MNTKKLKIILSKFKDNHIAEEEVIELIDVMYSNYYPYWPQITYTTPKLQKWEITYDTK